MNSFIISLLLIISFSFSHAQEEFAGTWLGKLTIQSTSLRIVLRIIPEGDSLKAFLDSPDQGAKDIPVSNLTIKESYIRADVAVISGYYEGELDRDSMVIKGTWSQGGMKLPLDLAKTDKVEEVKRPQNPVPPYPYNEEEVNFENKEAGISLAGTFTYPKAGSNFPAVVLISGSGPQDRDETLLNHKPFLVLSDYLTRKGIAVLRYDDRGIGKSGGKFSGATTMDFVTDALSAAGYLKTRDVVDGNKIGLAGHSEGGLIAPIAANREKDISFIVMMAGPGISGEEILLAQIRLVSEAEGMSGEEIEKELNTSKEIYELIKTVKDTAVLRERVREVFARAFSDTNVENQNSDNDAYINMQVNQVTSPWFRFFLQHDPYAELAKLKVPVLAINGENDLQVPSKENLKAIEDALTEGGNDNYKLVEMPGLNHLFQTSETGAVSEYNKIEETFSPAAMEIIAEWILSLE
jgi:uncharacterized protein